MWPSLGLQVDSQDLPDRWADALQQRWQKELDLPGLPLKLRCGKVPSCPVSSDRWQTLEVSGAQTVAAATTHQLWLGTGLFMQIRGEAPRWAIEVTLEPDSVQEVDLLLAFAEAHRLAGWLPLHACTVSSAEQAAGPERMAALSLSGVSGAGKSTAALRLMQSGYAVIAEDQTWLQPESGLVTGLDRFLRAYPASLERFAPQLIPHSRGLDSHGKCLLPLAGVSGGTLRALGFLGLAPSLSAAQRTQAVWECSGVPLMPVTRQQTAQAVQTMLRTVEIFGLSRDDVLEVAGRVLG